MSFVPRSPFPTIAIARAISLLPPTALAYRLRGWRWYGDCTSKAGKTGVEGAARGRRRLNMLGVTLFCLIALIVIGTLAHLDLRADAEHEYRELLRPKHRSRRGAARAW